MRKSRELHFVRQFFYALFLVLTVWFAMSAFTIVSHAQSQGKVTADSAKIRKEASTSSEVIGSADKDASVTINGQITGSDGNIWYQVFVDASTLGYIRSDLVSITDGSTPATLTSTSTSSTTTSSATATDSTSSSNETPATVTEVNPASATVTGGQAVRVRSNASTTSNIVTTAENGLAITVTGTATGSDGNEWYQVNFTVNGTEITGFIRSDYVNLSEELTAPEAEAPEEAEGNEGAEPEDTENDEKPKYEAVDEDGEWYLIDWYPDDSDTPGQYKISEIFESVDKNGELYMASAKNVKTLKAVVIVLVFLIIVLIAALTVMLFRAREAADAEYYAEVERETVRRRSADRPQGSGAGRQRAAGAERRGDRTRQGQAKSVQGQSKAPQGQTRAVQSQTKAPQGQTRTVQGQKNMQEQRPAQNASKQPVRGQDGRPVQRQGQRPAQGAQQRPQEQRPTQSVSPQRTAQTEDASAKKQQRPAQSRKPKNFMTDDDEFEFEFLNWDGEDDK